jgi:hypothetical protein
VRSAREGADIIAIDICKPIAGFLKPPSTPEDLTGTADLVKGHNRRIFTAEIDLRDYQALKAAVDTAVQQPARCCENPNQPAGNPFREARRRERCRPPGRDVLHPGFIVGSLPCM